MSYYIKNSFHVYAAGYEEYHHPQFLLISLQSTGCKRKLINQL
jgi:hypothetical protein